MIYETYDIVIVPFPFTDKLAQKRRPAIILSNYNKLGSIIDHSVCAMITSAKNSEWPLDTTISQLQPTGLSHPSIIRMKLFTIDNQLILRKAGRLTNQDTELLASNLQSLFCYQ